MASTLTISLDDQSEDLLGKLSQETGRQLVDLLLDAARRQLLVQEFHRVRALLAPLAPAADFTSEEEILLLPR